MDITVHVQLLGKLDFQGISLHSAIGIYLVAGHVIRAIIYQ